MPKNPSDVPATMSRAISALIVGTEWAYGLCFKRIN